MYIYFTFTLFFYFLFFLAFILLFSCPSPHCLSISSFFLHRPFFLPQRPIANLHEPSRHRPITIDPRSAADLTHFGLSSLFLVFRAVLVFWLCVLGCAYVSALCFGLWFFYFFFFFFTGFDGHGGAVVVQWFLWVWWWLWL